MTRSNVSLIIPLYNKREFIASALKSVAMQKVQPDEVIIVDDGSTDGSVDVICRFHGLPIRLIRQTNSGVSAARNRGIFEARCEWVAFLDADDEYLPTTIKDFCAARDKYPDAEVVFGRSLKNTSDCDHRPSEPRYVSIPDYFSYLMAVGAYEANSSSVMARKAAIESAGLFPISARVGEDTDTWFRLGCLYSFARVNSPVSIYHIHRGESNWQSNRGKEPYWFRTYAIWSGLNRISAPRRKSSRRYLEFCKLQMVIFHAIAGRRRQAFHQLVAKVNWARAPKSTLAKTLLIVLFPFLTRPVDRD